MSRCEICAKFRHLSDSLKSNYILSEMNLLKLSFSCQKYLSLDYYRRLKYEHCVVNSLKGRVVLLSEEWLLPDNINLIVNTLI